MSSKSVPDALPAVHSTERFCFVVSPIGEADSDTRRKSDQVLKHLIRKALEPEYIVQRADHIDRPGIITVQILQKIFDAELVVADLTDRNPNVYYELAIRHASRKPAIHIISRGQDIPFDVQDMRVVPYDLGDPDSLEEARAKLREYDKAIRKGEPLVTPIQFALILKELQTDQDRDTQIRTLFESLNTGMSNLQEGIAEIIQDLRRKNTLAAWSQQTIGGSPPTFFGGGFNALANLAAPPASGFNFPTRDESGAKAEAIKKAKESRGKK